MSRVLKVIKRAVFGKPTKVERHDIVGCTVLSLLVFGFAPDWVFLGSNVDWVANVIVFFMSFVAGIISAHFNEEDHPGKMDDFYIRAWWALWSGIVVVPFSLLFRIIAFDVAVTVLVFGLGPVLGNHCYGRFRQEK